MGLLCMAGLGGLPQVSPPLAEVDGLPVGVSRVTRRDGDEALLALVETVAVAISMWRRA